MLNFAKIQIYLVLGPTKSCLLFLTKNVFIGYFRSWTVETNIVILEISTLKVDILQNFEENKIPQIWDQKCFICVFWVRILRNYCLFEISTLKFVWLQNFAKKQKQLTLGLKIPYWVFLTKNALFWYFKPKLKTNYSHNWNQHPQICEIAIFCEKTKIPSFGTNIALLNIFHQQCFVWVF